MPRRVFGLSSSDESSDADDTLAEQATRLWGAQETQAVRGLIQPKGNLKGIGSFVQGAAQNNRVIARKRREASKVAAHVTARNAANAEIHAQLSIADRADWQAAVQADRFVAITKELDDVDDLLSRLE